MNFIFLTQQASWIPSGAVVTDGLDGGRCMELQCVVVEDSVAGAQHRCRLFFLLKLIGSVISIVVLRQRLGFTSCFPFMFLKCSKGW